MKERFLAERRELVDAWHAAELGLRFFEGTLPKIADELARLNTTLAALVAEMKASSGRANPAARTSSSG